MDRLISEKSVMEVIYGCDWFIDEEHAEVIKDRIKAIPSAKPKIVPIAEIKFDDDMLHELVEEAVKNIVVEYDFKGMTNGEVIKAMFGDDKVSEFMGYARIMARVGNWFNDGVVAEFDKDWWNSPYSPQESEG